MLPVIWSASARADLLGAIRHIAQSSPAAARALQKRIESAVLPLSEHPYLYRTGRVAGTRELVAHPNYMVIYRVLGNHVLIVGVLHTHREYP